MKKVHFMGIAGSGMAPIALIAKSMGYEVTGCDMAEKTYYSDELKKVGIEVEKGHDESHALDTDILAVTPAVFDYNPNHPEIVKAREKGILMTWQEFSGEYLQKDKKVIGICGTHGKSTTTSMIGLMLERAGLDPIVEAGTIIKEWGAGYRISNSPYFVIEADEFNNNFLNYHPNYIVINNIEMDHPEFFKDEEEMMESYVKFIKNLQGEKQLIVNLDNKGVRKVLDLAKDWIVENEVKVSGYSNNLEDIPDWINGISYEITKSTSESSEYKIAGDVNCRVGIMGNYNVENAMSSYCLSKVLNIPIEKYQESMENFHGIGRRMEIKYEKDTVTIYDDYAHHPTAVASVLTTLKSVYPDRKVVAIFEPHQISRMKLFMNEFCDSFKIADEMIITKTFVGREVLKNLEPVNMEIVKEKVGETLKYIEDFEEIVSYIKEKYTNNVVLVVLGAGNSYKLTERLVEVYQKA